MLFLSSQSFSQSAIPPDPERIMADFAQLKAYFPRFEGSSAEKETLAFIEKKLQAIGIAFNRFDFGESDLNHSFSSCLDATIPGKLEDTLILALPLNHIPEPGPGYGGSINIALALSILQQLQVRKPPITVKVLFLGAEFGEAPDYPMGSKLFLRDFYPEHRVMVLYLNLKTIPSRLYVRGGGRGIEAPYWLFERCTTALKATDIFFLVRGNENQVFRSGITAENTIVEPFLFAGYPAVTFEGEYESLTRQESKDWIFSFDLFFNELLQAFKEGIPETWDRHYLFFQLRDFYFSIDEKTYLIILLGLLGVVLLYTLIFTSGIKKYLKTLFRNIWNLPVFFLISFLLLSVSTWALEGILYIRHMKMFWASLPLLFLLFKITLPFLIFICSFGALKKLPFSRNGSFFSAGAILFLLIDILVLAVINISFTYYFLWAFSFALLFATTSNKILKLLFFLASPYWIVKTVVELFTLPELEFCRVILLSKIWGNLLLAVILLPFILMLIRLKMILPSPKKIPRRTRYSLTIAGFSLIPTALLITFLVFSPFDEQNKQPVSAHYFISREKSLYSLILSSSAPLGELYLWDDQNLTTVHSGSNNFTMPIREVPDPLEAQITSTGFLDRKNIDLTFAPKGKPFKLKLILTSLDEFVLFDSNFPYRRAESGREYQILIGVNPPLPLPVQLTLPQDMSFEMTVTLEYLSAPEGFEMYSSNKSIAVQSTFEKKFTIKT